MKNHLESNKLICKFMSVKYDKEDSTDLWIEDFGFRGNEPLILIAYHNDWNWLLKVVQVLFNTPFSSKRGFQDKMDEVFPTDVNMLSYPIELIYEKTITIINFLND